MAAELNSGAVAGGVADGMPVAAMNGGPTFNATARGAERLQEMPPAGMNGLQMPGEAALGGGGPPAQATPGPGMVIAPMPQVGGAATQASPPAEESGAIALRGEWRLRLTLRS